MRYKPLHPNTGILLEAWRRMETDRSGKSGPPAAEHPSLLENLFVIQRVSLSTAPFRITGGGVAKRLGGEDVDFMDMWRPQDRILCAGLLEAIIDEEQPGILQGIGETLTGNRMEVEIALAPLGKTAASRGRFLGLYQPVTSPMALKGQPVWRHQLTSLIMPEPKSPRMSHLRLVANNN